MGTRVGVPKVGHIQSSVTISRKIPSAIEGVGGYFPASNSWPHKQAIVESDFPA